MDPNKMKVVYSITERGEKSYWTKIGIGYVNRDGSLNLKLEALPINGSLHVRDWSSREEQVGRRNSAGSRSPAVEHTSDDPLPESFG